MNIHLENQEAGCKEVSEALSAYFDGAANEAEQQLATAHLARCSACAQMWGEWQGLRSMEQCALEPVASGEMLPLAPVKAPRHLKAAILRQTVSPPIWQRFWPRLLTGMAVPTVAVAGWLLLVASPWQQSAFDIKSPSNPIPADHVTTIPEDPAATVPSKQLTKTVAETPQKTVPVKTAKSITVSKNRPSRSSFQTKSRTVSAAHNSPEKQTPHIATTNAKKRNKSTFTGDPKPEKSNSKLSSPNSTVVKRPQVSMASLEQPVSRAVEPAILEKTETITTDAPKLLATEPVLVAELPMEATTIVETSSNPVLEYITASDIRPDSIRLAVENYRAALLDEGSDL